jgi:hypothetical protein
MTPQEELWEHLKSKGYFKEYSNYESWGKRDEKPEPVGVTLSPTEDKFELEIKEEIKKNEAEKKEPIKTDDIEDLEGFNKLFSS